MKSRPINRGYRCKTLCKAFVQFDRTLTMIEKLTRIVPCETVKIKGKKDGKLMATESLLMYLKRMNKKMK
jgi:hypothetical protein